MPHLAASLLTWLSTRFPNWFRHNAIARTEVAYQQRHAHAAAWAFWQAQPPSYQKGAAWWVVSAKKDETRRSRLATLIDDCANGRLIAQYRYGNRKPTPTPDK